MIQHMSQNGKLIGNRDNERIMRSGRYETISKCCFNPITFISWKLHRFGKHNWKEKKRIDTRIYIVFTFTRFARTPRKKRRRPILIFAKHIMRSEYINCKEWSGLPIWPVMQTRRTEPRRLALPLFICLRDRKDGMQRNAHPSANKDPHAEIYMALHAHILHAYTYGI